MFEGLHTHKKKTTEKFSDKSQVWKYGLFSDSQRQNVYSWTIRLT